MNWISVKDRLPQKEVLVLGLGKDNLIYTVYWEPSSHDQYDVDCEYKGIFIPFRCCCPHEKPMNYWLPLSEISLPKEVDGE